MQAQKVPTSLSALMIYQSSKLRQVPRVEKTYFAQNPVLGEEEQEEYSKRKKSVI